MTDAPSAPGDALPEGLLAFVHRRLCGKENLVPELFETIATPLVQRGAACGTRFELRGLRDVRLTAVWAATHQTVYFFDARGERFAKERFTPPRPIEAHRAAA